MSKTVVVGIRMSEEEKLFIQAKAGEQNETLPAFIKKTVLKNIIDVEESCVTKKEFDTMKKVLQKQLAITMKMASKTLTKEEMQDALKIFSENNNK
jgi:hypothetical protein